MQFQLLIHGGAGTITDKQQYREPIEKILEIGQKILANCGSALDAVEHCVVALENEPLFNAGKGSVLSHTKTVEMDAAIMNGYNLEAGSVAGVIGVKNPISLARVVMEKSEHVMLISEGAVKFAKEQNIEFAPTDYFLTEKRLKQWEEAQLSDKVVLDHTTDITKKENKKFGTVGAVAIDIKGNLAAATSTGGITNKKYGRVGDSPIIGAGVFADNDSCAVSATGYGEQFIRTTLSKTVAEFIKYKKMNAEEASKSAIKYLVQKVNGLGGLIVIDKNGTWGSAYSTEGMIYGRADKTGVYYLT